MSKHVIFFVHGVGDEKANWSESLRAEFARIFDSYPLPPGGEPFAEKFDTEEITYNDFFDAWRNRVAGDARGALAELGAEGLPDEFVARLFDLGIAAGGGGFLRTHAMDALQYRFLRLVSEPVRSAFEAQVLSRIGETAWGTSARWSVIAHSLGTAVAHDALHEMFAPGEGAGEARLYQPHTVAMLANVSQLLHNTKVLGPGVDAYRSFVRPSGDRKRGACRYYVSCANGFDPIATAGGFRPPDAWQTPSRFSPLDFESIPRSRQVHGFREYLAHPAVHVPLIRILTNDDGWISPTQEIEARARYAEENEMPVTADATRRAIEALGRRARGADWVELVLVWNEVLEGL